MGTRALGAITLCLALVGAAACKEENGVEVSKFVFQGNQAVSTAHLRSILVTQPSSRLPWGQKRYFNRTQFEADLKRIVAFYTDRGYPDARVTSFDVKLSEDQSSVAITLNISEGQPIAVERIAFEGFDAVPRDRFTALENRLPLKPGHPLDRALLSASREAALDELRDNGRPYASVRVEELPGSTDRNRVIEFTADPGPVATVGEIEVTGNSSVSDDVVRRQLTFKTGDLFRVSSFRQSQRRLYRLELFQFANIEPVQTPEQAEGDQVEQQAAKEGQGDQAEQVVVPTRVTVTEGKHRRMNFSFGYGSEEKARAEVTWRHVNFFGGARTASIRARYSSLDRGVQATLLQPYMLTPHLSLSITGQTWHTSEPAFTLDTDGGRVTLTREFFRSDPTSARGPVMTLALTYVNEFESSSISREALTDLSIRNDLIALGLDPRKGTSEGRRSAILFDATRNTTDNLLNARRGYLAAVHFEKAGRALGGTYDYYEVTGEGRYFQRIGNAMVLATQFRAGSIAASGDPDVVVPFHKRYFLGGATTLRGWGRYEVSPLSAFGLPIGGTTFMVFSTEARFPVWSKLGGVVFLDAGNVWPGAWDFHLNDLRYDVGPGLRYDTPIGPFRVDVGYQLNPIPGLLVNGEPQPRRWRIHFSIGQAF